MKRFRFRLQKVLEYREGLRKESERELAFKNRELFEREERLRGIMAEQDRAGGVGEKLTTMAEVLLHGDYYRYLQQSLVDQRERVKEATEAVDAAREAYLARAVEEEKLSTLKEKKHEEFKEERAKAERKQLDELTVTRFRLKDGIGDGE